LVEGVETTNESPADLVARLQKEGATGLAICGGAAIYNLFMQAGVADELYLTIEPILFGTGITLFREDMATGLALLDVQRLNDNTVLLHYSVKHS
jgi:dihydrofolate reductase